MLPMHWKGSKRAAGLYLKNDKEAFSHFGSSVLIRPKAALLTSCSIAYPEKYPSQGNGQRRAQDEQRL